jgi:hypothetical protein
MATDGPLPSISVRRVLGTLVPRVLLSVNAVITESRTLLSAALDKEPVFSIDLRSILSHPNFRGPKPGHEIITKCARIKSHTYDDSWYINECYIINT